MHSIFYDASLDRYNPQAIKERDEISLKTSARSDETPALTCRTFAQVSAIYYAVLL